jgi:hypothetical protein
MTPPKLPGALVQASPCTGEFGPGPKSLPGVPASEAPASGSATTVADDTTSSVMLLAGKVVLRVLATTLKSSSRTTAERLAGP